MVTPASSGSTGSPAGFDPAVVLARLGGVAPGRLVHVEELPARSASTSPWPSWVAPPVLAAVSMAGVEQLWSHQREAADLAHEGRHVVMSTGTASGKSLGYLLPALTAAVDGSTSATGRGATVLYLAPTKALGADQLDHITRLAIPGVRAAAYDGDTPADERRWIRDHANVVLTNPDLVHHSLLPGHERWASFLRALRYVVVDECHVYRGVFGSHVAAVLRRLRRVAARYRAAPTFVLASATVGEPARHAEALVGMPFTPVSRDGSPREAMTVGLWEPGALGPSAAGGLSSPLGSPTADGPARRSATTESADLLAGLVAAGVQTVAFAPSRAGVEALASAARRHLADVDPAAADRVAAYRGGYLPEERRELERSLRTGAIVGLAATNALELGIDVSGLDAVLVAGWPGRRASLWQRFGRAGRSAGRSLAILVGADDPLDSYLLRHPEAIFAVPAETTVLDPDNERVLAPHLAAAAAELPLAAGDLDLFGPSARHIVDRLVAAGILRRRPTGWYWARDDRPTDHVSLRGADEVVSIVEHRTGRVLGTIDAASAHSQVHTGAVHVHQGTTWVVTELDLESATATVVAGDPGWTTHAQSVSSFAIEEVERSERRGPAPRHRTPAAALEPGARPHRPGGPAGSSTGDSRVERSGARSLDGRPDRSAAQGRVCDIELSFGRVRVTNEVTGFVRRLPGGETIGRHPLDLPPRVLQTRAVWWTMTPEALAAAGIDAADIPGAAHAAEHAAIGMLPLVATSDRWDVGGVSTALHPDTGLPTIMVYDGYPGGAGFAARAHEAFVPWLRATRDTVASCPCADGCPACVHSPKCGNGNRPLDKAGAVRLLDLVLATWTAPTSVTPVPPTGCTPLSTVVASDRPRRNEPVLAPEMSRHAASGGASSQVRS